jgi:hypothetical protein
MVLGMVLAHRLVRCRANPLASAVRAVVLASTDPHDNLNSSADRMRRPEHGSPEHGPSGYCSSFILTKDQAQAQARDARPRPPKSKGLTSGPHHHPCSTHLGSPAFCGCTLMAPAQSRELKRGVAAQIVLPPTPVSLNI